MVRPATEPLADATDAGPAPAPDVGLIPDHVVRQSFTVAFDYPVVFTTDALAVDNPALLWAIAWREPNRRHRVLAVLDDGVARAWPLLGADLAGYADAFADQLELCAEPIVIEGGEGGKNRPELVGGLQARFQAARLDRQSVVLVVGGGAAQDVAGYAAATAHRGLRVVRAPTTVLAQCDSGIGVKNAVNAFSTKNFLGTFAPPFAGATAARFLAPLAERDGRAGMAEAVKVALIRDAGFFAWLEDYADALARFERPALATLIRRAAELHLDHIARGGDPFEMGSARPLDFGHWAAHKLEALSGFTLRHGEAVAIGLALDTRYAHAAGLAAEPTLTRVCALLERLGFRLWHDALTTADGDGRPAILAGLREFREHLGGELSITLLAAVGRGVDVGAVDEGLLARSLAWLRRRDEARARGGRG
jgi:3-dehydroquinate synthase